MTRQDINIKPIEENLYRLQTNSASSIESELNELKRAKKEKLLEKRIEELQNEIRSIQRFLDEGGLDRKIKEAEERLEQERAKKEVPIKTLKGKPTLVDFWAEWCAPCKFIGRTVHELKEKYNDSLNVLQIDTETEVGNKLYMTYANIFNVNAIPFLLLFDKDGNYNSQLLGADPNRLVEMVEAILNE
ncbi:MAG: thioredoxin domain-containing protein [Candidatus Helarchaeota archaeon]